jgi:hypothetical protein
LLSLLGALLVFVEYSSVSPSLIDFRSAPPFNRLRFSALFLTVLAMTQMHVGSNGMGVLGEIAFPVAARISALLDFPFSPVRLIQLTLPEGTAPEVILNVKIFAGFAYGLSITMIVVFVLVVRLLDWPLNSGAFNVLTNLPLFDPTTGGDVLRRMKRDSTINLVLGFLLPFLLPAIVKATSSFIDPRLLMTAQTMIWSICIWAFIPASMFMRGIALWRISDLIEEKRRRTYARRAEDGDGLQTA